MLAAKKLRDARWRLKNPHKMLGYAIKKKLGDIPFTAADYVLMNKRQHGRCAICRKKPKGRLHVDHCHKRLFVRGLLCAQCNHGLGLFYDNIKSLQSAITYLKK